jgi:hypothetical protein
MKLRELIKRTSWKVIEKQSLQMGYKKYEVGRLRNVWQELRFSNSKVKDNFIEIRMDVDAYYENTSEGMYLFGVEDGNTDLDIDLSFYEWSDWLDFEVYELLNYVVSEAEIIIYCMNEMTLWGLNRYKEKECVGMERIQKIDKLGSNVLYLSDFRGN